MMSDRNDTQGVDTNASCGTRSGENSALGEALPGVGTFQHGEALMVHEEIFQITRRDAFRFRKG
jgi:hypothetical protein